MRSNKILVIVIVLFLAAVVFAGIKFGFGGKGTLVSPGVKGTVSESSEPALVPTNNPPKNIQYDSQTDLQKELDSIDPQVLDEDFET